MLEEALEETNRVADIMRTTGLTAAVHAQLGVTQVQGTGTQSSRQHRANGATAARIVADYEQLQGKIAALIRHLLCDLLEKHNARRVSSIASIGIDLDHGALVHLGLVVGLVLGGIVGVDGVGHVGRHKEGSREGLLIGSCQVNTLGRRRREHRQATNDSRENVRVGTLSGAAANLLVVEEGNKTDAILVVERRLVIYRVGQSDDGAVGAVQVVQTGREDELVVHATEAGLLRIEKDHLKVQDILGLDLGGLGDYLHERGVMTLSRGLQRGELIHSLGGLRLGSTVELGLQTSDGEQLSLLVEGK